MTCKTFTWYSQLLQAYIGFRKVTFKNVLNNLKKYINTIEHSSWIRRKVVEPLMPLSVICVFKTVTHWMYTVIINLQLNLQVLVEDILDSIIQQFLSGVHTFFVTLESNESKHFKRQTQQIEKETILLLIHRLPSVGI